MFSTALLRCRSGRRDGCTGPLRRPLDHVHELVERRRQTELLTAGIDAEFVMATAQVLHEGVATEHDRRGPVALEAALRSQPGLQSAVVSLYTVVRPAISIRQRIGKYLVQNGEQCWGLVSHHLHGLAVIGQGAVEEPASSPGIAAPGHVHVDR
jgi:hypothetical protein